MKDETWPAAPANDADRSSESTQPSPSSEPQLLLVFFALQAMAEAMKSLGIAVMEMTGQNRAMLQMLTEQEEADDDSAFPTPLNSRPL